MNSKKTITIVSANYYPEDTAIGLYTSQFSDFLKNKGFSIKIITGFPSYPQWRIYDKYKSMPNFYKEMVNEIEIIRYKQFVPKKVNFIGRVLMMLSFIYGCLINIRKVNKSELVICIVPYTLSIIPAFILSKKTNSKLWVHIQDFEFDLALDSGIIKKKKGVFSRLFTKTLYLFEKRLLHKAFIISSISGSMLNKIKVKSNKTDAYYFPNWVSSEKINPNNGAQHRYINTEKFTLLYSGNIGEKQDWDLFFTFCELIKPEDHIQISIVGNGVKMNELQLKTKRLDFVSFHDVVPFEELSCLLCAADMHFLFQKNNVVDSVMPSKILGMMASSKPSIITGNKNSEVKNIIEISGGGVYFDTSNPVDLYKKIIELKSNPLLREKMGTNARKYILNNFSESVVLENVYEKIMTVIS